MKGLRLEYSLYSLLIFLSVFNDSVFSKWFGYFGRPILSVSLPVILLLYVFSCKRMNIDHFAKQLIQLTFFLVIVNVVTDLFYFFFEDITYIERENIFLKSLKGITYMLYNTVYYMLIYNLGKNLSIQHRLRPFAITFFFLFFILIVELFTMPNAWPILHQNHQGIIEGEYIGKEYYRVRLTTTESSLTVPLIVVFGSLTLMYYNLIKDRRKFFLTISCIILFVVTSTARTMLIFAVGFGGFIVLKRLAGRKKRLEWVLTLIFATLFLPIATFFLVIILYKNIFMQSLGSLATRGTSFIAAILHMFKYPLGMGNSISILTMYDITNNISGWLSQHFDNLNFYELNLLLTSNNEKLSAYGALTYSLYWGLPGTVLFYCGITKIYKSYCRSRFYSHYFAGVYWGFILIMTLTVPINNCFPFWGFLAVVTLFSKDKEKIMTIETNKNQDTI